jgi:hypothetical protein
MKDFLGNKGEEWKGSYAVINFVVILFIILGKSDFKGEFINGEKVCKGFKVL